MKTEQRKWTAREGWTASTAPDADPVTQLVLAFAGDGAAFGETLVWTGGAPRSGVVAVVGLYGRRLRVGFGSLGGWDSFGPERLITRSSGNVLYEFDGQSALGLYKRYLGGHAAGLPMIFCSGCTEEMAAQDAWLRDGDCFIEKPIDLDGFVRQVRAALDASV